MAEHAPAVHLELGLTLGVIEIGVLMSTLLYGMTLVQTYIYAMSSSQDRIWMKLFVAIVWFVNLRVLSVFQIGSLHDVAC
jgi:hypothetical protein